MECHWAFIGAMWELHWIILSPDAFTIKGASSNIYYGDFSELGLFIKRLLESHPSYSVFFTGRQNNNGVAHALAQHAITLDVSHAFYQLIPCIAEVLFNEMPQVLFLKNKKT